MASKKILPVYSAFPDSFWGYDLPVKFMGRKSAMPPTGLATVCALLPERYEALPIVDLNAHPDGLTDEKIDSADYVMTSSMIIQRESHEEVVERAHSRGKKVIAGGPYVSTYFDETSADYVLSGDGEVVLNPFLKELDAGTARRVWREKEILNHDAGLLNSEGRFDIKNTPLPRWDLLNLDDYVNAAIQFSRGCPMKCDFCDIPRLYGTKPRTKSPEQMVKELDSLYTEGFRGSVFIVDDNFIGNRNDVRKLLPELTAWQEKHNFPFSFFTEASMNLSWDQNKDILLGMQKAGFDMVFLGIESVDQGVLSRMNKGINTRTSPLEAVRKIQAYGIEVSGGFIVGNDGEGPNVYKDLFNFIQEAGIPVSMAGLLTALKGTPLYDKLESDGRLLGETSGNNTHHLGRNFSALPGDSTEEEVIGNYKELLGKLFDPKHYFDRCRVLEENLGPSRTIGQSGLRGLVGLVRSVFHQLGQPGKKEYFSYLLDSAKKGKEGFTRAATHAVKFAHFQKITKQTLEED